MRIAIRLATLVPGLLLALSPARAPFAAALPDGISPFKAREIRMLAEEPMRERVERYSFREREPLLRRLARHLLRAGATQPGGAGQRARPELTGDRDAVRDAVPAPLARSRERAPSPSALGANVRCNDPAGDRISPVFGRSIEGQCETAIARWNDGLVAAWNDGKGFDDGTGQTVGWATSSDGGATWTDHGTLPLPPKHPTWIWTSDPVLAVNPTTGAIYLAALGGVRSRFSSVGVIKGRFTNGVFAWGAPSLVREAPLGSHFLDKEWLAVDPDNGRVVVTYTDFIAGGSVIECQWADSALAAWSRPARVSLASEQGRVQGSRPAVGPRGEVFVTYFLVGLVDVDVLRIARSTSGGNAFSAPTDAVAFFPNYGTGAPGFSRSQGIHFPSIAIDRSRRAHDGRIHLAWNESLNWFDDTGGLGAGPINAEIEPNDVPADATPVSVGDEIHGTFWGINEYDHYAMPMTAGQSVIVAVDSLENGQSVTLRMFAPDGVSSLTYLVARNTDIDPGEAPPLWVFTAPATATYYLRLACVRSFGRYRVRTAPALRTTERGRDQRDVFTAWSDDGGVTWSKPVRVNHEPAGYDDWLPEIAVTPTGQVVCAWYDWRDSPPAAAGGESSVYLATSSDGGTSWYEQGAVTDVRTAWSGVATNISPNQGDYLALAADAQGYAVCWSDGRDGDPDTYMAAVGAAIAAVAAAPPSPLHLAADAALASAPVRLAFELPSPGLARLRVLDVTGREVRALLAGALGAGPQAATWDLHDDAGSRVAPGLYWALLEAAGRRASARLVVLR